MQLRDQRILLTGASSGIGRELALELARRGARIALVARRSEPLQAVAGEITAMGGTAVAVVADVTTSEGRAACIAQSTRALGGLDVLINGAGTSDFAHFACADPVQLEQIIKTNLLAPMLLAREVLPQMIRQKRGRIVNIGSIFGSIGFAYFAAYSSTKFGLRGFSEALRRELHGTGVGVTYAAPRAVKTALNSPSVLQMADAVGMKMDEPVHIAAWIVRAIEKDRKDAYYGAAERFFVKLNGLFPRLVDRGLDKQNRAMRDFAQPTSR